MNEQQKEIALVTAVIIHNDLLRGSLYQVFDKAYDIAKEIVDFHLPKDDLFWGEHDHEEWVVNLVKIKFL